MNVLFMQKYAKKPNFLKIKKFGFMLIYYVLSILKPTKPKKQNIPY